MEIRAFLGKVNYVLTNDFILAIRSKNPRVLQPIALFGSMILSMGLTFLSSIITARALGPSSYGDLKYVLTVWSLLALALTFGYFYSGSRALVLESDIQKCRELSGTIILISLIMGLIISAIGALLAYPLDYIFHVNLASIMVRLAPLIIVIPLSQCLSLILQATNQIYLLSTLTGTPSFLYLVTILVLSRLKHVSTSSVLLSQQLTTLIVILFVLVYIKPSLKSVRFWWSEIKGHHKSYGFPVYKGALAGIGSTHLNRLAISYWADNTAIGFFSLASSLVTPLSLIPNAMATSSFRGFATEQRISKKSLVITITISFAALALAFIFFGTPLSLIYTTKFNQVGPMARALGFGAILIGFGDLFNRFLGAHGKGKSIQKAAYANGIATVACIFIFIPIFGAWGAVIATILPNGVYLLLMYSSYRAVSHNKIPQPLRGLH